MAIDLGKYCLEYCFLLYLGTYVFNFGYEKGFMPPSNARVYMDQSFMKTWVPSVYPKFSAIVYSIDTLVPFLNLYQKAYWLPDASRGSQAQWVRIYGYNLLFQKCLRTWCKRVAVKIEVYIIRFDFFFRRWAGRAGFFSTAGGCVGGAGAGAGATLGAGVGALT